MNQRTKAAGKLSFLISLVKSSELFWIVSFAILTAIGAQLTIPVKPVPFTLQVLFVLLAGALLGAKNGAYSQLLYLALGVTGLPVFAQTGEGGFGFAQLIGPTGGYLLAFPVAAFVVGYLVNKYSGYVGVVVSMFIGYIIVLLFGTVFLNSFFLHDWSAAINGGAGIFSIWMVVKVFAAASVYFGIKKAQK